MSPRFDPEVLSENGVACPYNKASPEKYRGSGHCCPEKGWASIGHAIEHVKRHHTPSWNCVYCGIRWLASKFNDKTLLPVRTAHLEECRPKYGGLVREIKEDEPEIMTENAEIKFRGLKSIRKNNEEKLVELYRACGKDLPETYHVQPLEGDLVPSQLPSCPTPALLTTKSSTFLDGYILPDLDPMLAPSCTLSWEVRNLNSACFNEPELEATSGPEAAGVQHDSGYGDSAEQDAPYPEADLASYFQDSGGSCSSVDAHLLEHNAFDLVSVEAHHGYPTEIVEPFHI